MSIAAPAHAEEVTIRGRVVHLFFQSPTFTAGIVKWPEGTARFSGNIMVAEGDDVSLIGHWAMHPQYGRQFKVQGLRQELPMDAASLARYLAEEPDFRGIGPEKARRIADAFGETFDYMIREEPERVAREAKLSPPVLQTLRDKWLKRAEINALMAWLCTVGLTHRQITKIMEHLGHNAKALLQENPYHLCRLLPGFGFGRVDEMALRLGVDKEHPERIAAAFKHLLRQAEQDGHCWIEEEALLHEAFKILCLDALDAKQTLAAHLDRNVESGTLFRYDGGGRWVIALPELAQKELEIIEILLREGAVEEEDDTDWPALLDEVAPSLNPSQRTAALQACRQVISLIAGAAGSGKSYTIAAIYRAFSRLWDDVELAAPTGKAAKRLAQLCGVDAKTIHRLLEYNTVSWGRDRDHPLEASVVIVDEVSMCDIRLLWQLLTAIDFSTTKLVLVGDPNQLPPVGPGNVLRDLLMRRVLATTVLDQVVRQAGTLKENCTAILQGDVRDTADGVNGVLRPWYLITDCAHEEMTLQTLETLVTESLPRLGIDPVQDAQILTPSNKGPLGTRALNILLQRVLQRQRYGIDVAPVPEHRRPPFYIGDKIMQTRNNYDLELMNGAIGVVRDIVVTEETPGKPVEMLVLDFEGRVLHLPRQADAVDDLMLAYASTVHKCQGSEFPVVIAVVHRAHAFMLNRNLLYTAVTRARTSAILLGDRSGLRRAISTRAVDARRTFLALVDFDEVKGVRP